MKFISMIKSTFVLAMFVVLASCSSSGVSNNESAEASSSRTKATSPASSTTTKLGVVKAMSFDEASVVNFAFDRSDLSQDQKLKLDTQVDYLKKNPNVRVTVAGHTDYMGTREYNLALGERRATAVKNYLVSSGIDASRIDTVSYGKERLLDTAETPEANAKNRRAETTISK